MSEIERPPVLFGQMVGEAGRALRAVADGVLEREGIAFEGWLVLNSVGLRGGSAPGEALRHDLGYALGAEPAAVALLLDGLRASGDLSLGGEIAFTAAGAERYAGLRAAVAAASAELLDGIDPGEVAAARRVLGAVTARATALRAAA